MELFKPRKCIPAEFAKNIVHQFELAFSIPQFIENLDNRPRVHALALKRFWESLRKSSACTPIQQQSHPLERVLYIQEIRACSGDAYRSRQTALPKPDEAAFS